MKRNAFLKYLKANDCILVREGANHSLYLVPLLEQKKINGFTV